MKKPYQPEKRPQLPTPPKLIRIPVAAQPGSWQYESLAKMREAVLTPDDRLLKRIKHKLSVI